MENNFKIFVPIEVLEKADSKKDKDGLPEELLIGGVVSDPSPGYDKDNQLLDPNGFNYKPFLAKGFINAEHGYAKTKDASMIIGEPTDAWVKDNKFHIRGKLYKENPKAVAMYQLAQVLKKSGSKRTIGYSLEGNATEYDPLDPRKVTKADIFHCAVTIAPKCDGTYVELIKGGDNFNYETQAGSEFLIDVIEDGFRYTVDKSLNIERTELEKGGEGSRGGKVIGHTRSGKAIYYYADHEGHKDFTDEDHYDAGMFHGYYANKERNKRPLTDRLSDKPEKGHGPSDEEWHHGTQGVEHKKKMSKPIDDWSELVHSSDHTRDYFKSKKHLKLNKAMTTDNGAGGPEYAYSHAPEAKDDKLNEVEKAMTAGAETGRDTTGKLLTQEPLKEEDIDGAKKKKKKEDVVKNLVAKESLTKSETYIKLFSMFNFDIDSAKRVYELTERIQRQLTPMAEVQKVSPEALQKALETLNLVKAVEISTEAKPTAEEAAKIVLQEELKKAEEQVQLVKAKIEGKTEPVIEVKKESVASELSKATEEKILALGTVAAKAIEDNTEIKKSNEELKKAIETIQSFNTELAKKLGMIADQPLDRKSVTTQKHIERFEGDGLNKGGEGKKIETLSMSNPKEKAKVADVLFKATVEAGFDEHGVAKDNELFKATQYVELGNFPNSKTANAIQERLLKNHGIRLVK